MSEDAADALGEWIGLTVMLLLWFLFCVLLIYCFVKIARTCWKKWTAFRGSGKNGQNPQQLDVERNQLWAANIVKFNLARDRATCVKFYTHLRNDFLSNLDKLGFDCQLPELGQTTTLTVEDVVEQDLTGFPEVFSGVELFKNTLQVLSHRIQFLSNLEAESIQDHSKLIEINKDVVSNMDVITMMDQYRYPDQVVNGYWIYNASTDKGPDTDKNCIQICPSVVSQLARIRQKGSFKFEKYFQKLAQIDEQMTAFCPGIGQISGFVCLQNCQEIDSSSGWTVDVEASVKCSHRCGKSDTWYCSGCCGAVKIYRGPQQEYFYSCQNCGFYRFEDSTCHCFCRDSERTDSKMTDFVEKVVFFKAVVEEAVNIIQDLDELSVKSFDCQEWAFCEPILSLVSADP